MAFREYLYNQRTYAPHLEMAGGAALAQLGVSALLNTAFNALVVAGSIEAGVFVGSLIDATIQTFLIPETEGTCK